MRLQTRRIAVPIITDWNQSITFTFSSGWGTVTAITMLNRRIGDSLYVRGYFTLGTVQASVASIALPANLRIDTVKLGSGTNVHGLGTAVFCRPVTAQAIHSSDNIYIPFYDGSDATTIYFAVKVADTANQMTKANGNQLSGNNGILEVRFDIPIAGWRSNRYI